MTMLGALYFLYCSLLRTALGWIILCSTILFDVLRVPMNKPYSKLPDWQLEINNQFKCKKITKNTKKAQNLCIAA